MLKKIIIARCGFESDIELIKKMTAHLAEIYDILIFKNEVSSIVLKESAAPEFSTDQSYSSLVDFVQQSEIYNTYEEVIALHAYGISISENCLAEILPEMINRGKSYIQAEFYPITKLKVELIRGEALEKIAELSSDAPYLHENTLLEDSIILPQPKDYVNFYRDKFDELFRYPKTVVLNVFNGCNKKCLKCFLCSPDAPMSKSFTDGKMMPLETVEKIFKEISTYENKPTVSLGLEPLAYPHLEGLLKLVETYELPLYIVTNGLNLTKEKAELLLACKQLNYFEISIDAVTQETYEKVQPPGELKRVEDNLDRFLEMKGDSKQPNMIITYVKNKHNEHEFDPFLKKWLDKSSLLYEQVQVDPDENLIFKAEPIMKNWTRVPCMKPWNDMIVYEDGSLRIGCPQYRDHEVFDESKHHIDKMTIFDFWNSDVMNMFRDKELDGEYMEFCKGCMHVTNLIGKSIERQGDIEIITTPLNRMYYSYNKADNS